MAASATFDPFGVPLAGFPLQTAVFIFDQNANPDQFGDPQGSLTLLPNVQVWNIDFREGNDPPTARLGYILDDRSRALGLPSQIEQLWPLDLPNPNLIGQYIADPEDRIVVMGAYPDGTTYVLFDGFTRLPTAHVTSDSQAVTLSAVGTPIRAWDNVINGRWQRDATDPQNGAKIFVNLPCRFNPVFPGNPSSQPNCTPDGFDENQDDSSTAYPTFLDPGIDRTPTPLTDWTLSKAVRYLLSFANPQEDDSTDDDPFFVEDQSENFIVFVQNPDFDDLTAVLDNRKPLEGQQYFDPNDSSTFTADPIVIRDFDATNMAWPDAIERLLGYYGFGMAWVLTQDESGNPTTTFSVYRKDAGNSIAPKVVNFATVGTAMNPAIQNVGALSGSFDYHSVANQFVIETHPNRYEVSFILAPGFTPTKGDELADNRTQFQKQNLFGAPKAVRQKYRYYVADECGDGFFDIGTSGGGGTATGTGTGGQGGTGTNAGTGANGGTGAGTGANPRGLTRRNIKGISVAAGSLDLSASQPTIKPHAGGGTGTGGGTTGSTTGGGDDGDGGSGDTSFTFVTGTALNLSTIFPDTNPQDGSDPQSSYVFRYRPCAKKLLTEDGNGDNYPAQLALSRDYVGPVACLWDGKKGTWQPIDDGSWNLLPDRIGIMFTGDDPEAIKIGKFNPPEGTKKQETSEKLRGVTCLSNPSEIDADPPTPSQELFFLRLTTVIESDTTLEATALRRNASPLQNVVERRIDAKEIWRKDTVTKNSAFFSIAKQNFMPDETDGEDEDGGNDDDTDQIVLDAMGNLVVRDDTEAATDHAAQLRTVHEFPKVATTFTIPMFTMAYNIGDQIALIAGRNISLQQNAGAEQDEAPSFPVCIGISWEFQKSQQTVLQMSDKRFQPPPLHERRRGLGR
jgi:hypothetical protein